MDFQVSIPVSCLEHMRNSHNGGKMDRECVITGIGLMTPAGIDKESFFQKIHTGTTTYRHRQIFKEENPSIVSPIDEKGLADIPKRQLKKIDWFTVMAILAANRALEDANLIVNSSNQSEIGIVLGNCFGGLGYVESQLAALHRIGFSAINSYVATAWFPTAPQGEISIKKKIKGYSKTVSSDLLSGGFALQHAIQVLQLGKAEAVLAGGAEAPLTPLVYQSLQSNGFVPPQGEYRPFTDQASGHVIAEGSVLLVLENREYAIKRRTPILGIVKGIGLANNLENSISMALGQADLQVGEIDFCIPDASADEKKDQEEIEVYRKLGIPLEKMINRFPKKSLGHLLSASIPADIAFGIFQSQYHQKSRSSFIVNARDWYGQSMSFLIQTHP